MGDYVLVPRVATEAMLEAGIAAVKNWPPNYYSAARGIYPAMLAARPPVDYDALAVEVMRKFYGAPDDVLIGSGDIPHMAQALRELLP